MSKTVIVTLKARETFTKTIDIAVRVPNGISTQKIEELIMDLDLEIHPGLDWEQHYEDIEIHAAEVTDLISGSREPDVVIERLGEEFEASVNI